MHEYYNRCIVIVTAKKLCIMPTSAAFWSITVLFGRFLRCNNWNFKEKFINFVSFKCQKRHVSYSVDNKHYHLLSLEDRCDGLDSYAILYTKIIYQTFLMWHFCTSYVKNAIMTRLLRTYINKLEGIDKFLLAKKFFRDEIVTVLTSN